MDPARMDNPARNHLLSFTLPVAATILIPGILLWSTRRTASLWRIHFYHLFLQITVGILFVLVGILLGVASVRPFIRIGKGTLAPWHPTRNLVVSGVYQHTRNPMISGVLFILLGQSIVFGSVMLFLWFICFFLGNAIYFILIEEPGLESRFGAEYLEYKKNVPRWIPRIRGWKVS